MTDDPKPKRKGRLFQPGQSGNPNGRKKGSRNKITQAIEAPPGWRGRGPDEEGNRAWPEG